MYHKMLFNVLKFSDKYLKNKIYYKICLTKYCLLGIYPYLCTRKDV